VAEIFTHEQMLEQFRDTADFTVRRLRCEGQTLWAYAIDGLTSGGDISEHVFRPVTEHLHGATAEELRCGMASFAGADRRFDFHIKRDDLVMLSDYAHHPDEVRACAQSIKELYRDKKTTVLFQPHLFSRTADFYKEFAQSLSLFDKVILVDIYPAREKPMPGVTSKLIYDCLEPHVEKAMCSRSDVLDCIEREKGDIEVLVSLGAGDIENDVPRMKEILENR
jgi:UDP-N-acetylmuramate--alanine ligase